MIVVMKEERLPKGSVLNARDSSSTFIARRGLEGFTSMSKQLTKIRIELKMTSHP